MKRNPIPLLVGNGTETTIAIAVRDYSPLSRARLSLLTGLPHAAISRSSAKLIGRGLLSEKKKADKSGIRAKRGLCLNPDAGRLIGLEYSPSGLICVLADSSYRLLKTDSRTIDFASMDNRRRLRAIVDFIGGFLGSHLSGKEKVIGVGIADPGIVDPGNGVSVSSTLLPGWSNIPVAQKVSDALGLPSLLMNSMEASITAVSRTELDSGINNVIFIEYGDGIACGMKLNGRHYGGQDNRAGEIGHFRISELAVPCRCGSVGCLEAVAAIPALARKAKSALLKESSSALSSLGNFDGRAVLDAAAKGDRLAGRVVDEAFRILARTIAGTANLLSPEMIVLDPSISLAGESSFKSFEREFELSLLNGAGTRISISKIGPERNAMGAAFSVMDSAIGDSH